MFKSYLKLNPFIRPIRKPIGYPHPYHGNLYSSLEKVLLHLSSSIISLGWKGSKKAMNSLQQVRGTFSKWHCFIWQAMYCDSGIIQVCLSRHWIASKIFPPTETPTLYLKFAASTYPNYQGQGPTDFCRMLYSKISKFSFWYQSFMVQLGSKLLQTYSQTNVFTYVYLKSSLSSPLSSDHPRPFAPYLSKQQMSSPSREESATTRVPDVDNLRIHIPCQPQKLRNIRKNSLELQTTQVLMVGNGETTIFDVKVWLHHRKDV